MKLTTLQTQALIWVCTLVVSTRVACGQTAGVTSPATSTTNTATATEPTTPPPASADATMGTIVVNGVPLEENIMPTSRPVNSVLGLDLPVLDTPRDVTIISREQLSMVDITDARDYSKLTSDSYTESDFGTPATPAIRGQPADVFINGQRSGWNADGNGPPVDFNNIDSVNIVKGPPTADSGQSIFVGGYVDEQTKRPYFDKFQGDAQTTLGMYDQYRQTLDFGGPIINNELAYRISYTGDESGSYYHFVHDDAQYGYGALSWVPSDKYTLDFNASFGEVDYLENNGINRVTQALIDNGTYITGQSASVSSGVPGYQSGFFNNYTTTGTTQINRADNIRNPNDGAYAQTANAQIIQTVNVNDDVKIVDNMFGQYLNWRTYNSQFYDQYSDGDYSFDNKISIQMDTDIPVTGEIKSPDPKGISEPGLTFHNQLVTGVDFRYQANNDYESIASEPFNIYDITQDPHTVFNQIPPSQYGTFKVAHIPGLPDKYVFDILSADSGKSVEDNTGFFAQDVLKFTDQWSLIFGGRADVVYVTAATPPGTPSADYYSDSTTMVLPTYNVSPTFKPFPWMTLYATYNGGQSPTVTGQTGSFSPYALGPEGFHANDSLYEIGAKFNLLDNKLFISTDVYKEDRYDPASGGSSYKQRVNGAEVEVNYQPDKHFYATASYSWFEGHDINPGFIYNTVPENQAVRGSTVTADTPSFLQSGVDSGSGTYKSPGFPVNSFNALAVYKFDCGLGFSADLQVTSPINVSWVGGVQIPWQYNVDMSTFYTYKQSEIKLSVYNVTDAYNWGSTNPIYGLDSIFAEEPIHAEVTLKYHF
jgi:outer membrane receptor protein involved in Fe transport